MRIVGLRQLYRNLGRELKNLPFVVTNHNKPVAIVLDKEEYIKIIKKEQK